MSFGWWTILDKHGKLLNVRKSDSVAVFDTLKPVRLATTTMTRSKALQYFVLPSHPLNGTHTQSMSQLSQIFFNLSPPLPLHCLKWILQVTSIRDHSFHQDSPGQSMSRKEQVFLIFCTLSV